MIRTPAKAKAVKEALGKPRANQGEHPIVDARQVLQQRGNVRGQWDDALALDLVADGQALPFGVEVLPTQAEHFAGRAPVNRTVCR